MHTVKTFTPYHGGTNDVLSHKSWNKAYDYVTNNWDEKTILLRPEQVNALAKIEDFTKKLELFNVFVSPIQ